MTFTQESKWRCGEQLRILDIKIADKAEETGLCSSWGGALVVWVDYPKFPPPPPTCKNAGIPPSAPPVLRALMRQFLNKRKSTTPEPGGAGGRRSPTWQPDAHLGTERPPLTLTPDTDGRCGDAAPDSPISGCVGNFPDNGSAGSHSHGGCYKQFCPQIAKRRKPIVRFPTDTSPRRHPQCYRPLAYYDIWFIKRFRLNNLDHVTQSQWPDCVSWENVSVY